MPFKAFQVYSQWSLVGLTLTTLFLRRIPALLLSYRFMKDVSGIKDALVMGFFGPIGVSSCMFAMVASMELRDTPQPPEHVVPIVLVLVLMSVFGHGLAVPFLQLLYHFRHRVLLRKKRGAGPDGLPTASSSQETLTSEGSVYTAASSSVSASDLPSVIDTLGPKTDPLLAVTDKH